MCDSCGCQTKSGHDHDAKVVEVNKSLLAANEEQAAANRRHIEKMGAIGINLIIQPNQRLFIPVCGNLKPSVDTAPGSV